MNWKLQSYSNCKGSHCEVCGTGITHNWYITNGQQTMRVGTECMFQFTGLSNLKEKKRLNKIVQMAVSLYAKHRMNYGEDFRSFWIDFYVNVEIHNITLEPKFKTVYNVWKYFWEPFNKQEIPNDFVAPF